MASTTNSLCVFSKAFLVFVATYLPRYGITCIVAANAVIVGFEI
jgi:hypothetical protein